MLDIKILYLFVLIVCYLQQQLAVILWSIWAPRNRLVLLLAPIAAALGGTALAKGLSWSIGQLTREEQVPPQIAAKIAAREELERAFLRPKSGERQGKTMENQWKTVESQWKIYENQRKTMVFKAVQGVLVT